MSTKIYNGYRLAAGTDPFTFIAAARPVIDAVRDNLDAALLAFDAVRLIDNADLAGEVRPGAPLAKALWSFQADQMKLKSSDYGHDPHRFELSFGLDPDTGRYGVMLYAEDPALREAFKALPEVEDFGYWDNADSPDGMSAKQWKARSDFWDRLMPENRPPVETMLGWVLRSTYNRLAYHLASVGDDGRAHPAVLANLPLKRDRATIQAERAVTKAAAAGGVDLSRGYMYYASSNQYPEVVAAFEAVLVDIDSAVIAGDGLYPEHEDKPGPAIDADVLASLTDLATTAYERLAAAKPDL